MSKLREENGYAALIAILVILLLTILGTNLLQVTMSSLTQIRKTEARGESQYYARMGMEEALARLTKAIEEINAQLTDQDISSKDIYQGVYQTVFNRHLPVGFAKSYTSRDSKGAYQIKLRREVLRPTSEADLNNPNSPIVEKFTFTVVGTADAAMGRESTTMQSEIYVNSLPEEFHYVLSTPADPSEQCRNDSARCNGRISLNGAPYIDGDVYSNVFKMSDVAHYFVDTNGDGKPKEIDQSTSFPAIIGQMGGPFLKSGQHLYRNDVPFSPEVKMVNTPWYQSFAIPPTLNLNNTPTFDNIKKISAVVDGQLRQLPPFHESLTDEDVYTASEMLTPTDPTGHQSKKGVRIMPGVELQVKGGNFVVNGVLSMDTAANQSPPILSVPQGNLIIAGNTADSAGQANNQAAYLRGEVRVGPNGEDGSEHFIFINGNAVFEDLTCNETIYINGDLYVEGSFQMNATVYVKGNVGFTEEATKQELNNGTLVLLSGGQIEFYNISPSNIQKQINAFLYSDSPEGITLYGVGSNLKIVGGIHARKIELNAVRRDLELRNNAIQFGTDGKIVFADTERSNPTQSRLVIAFNNQLFEHPPPGIPIIHRLKYKISSFVTLTQ